MQQNSGLLTGRVDGVSIIGLFQEHQARAKRKYGSVSNTLGNLDIKWYVGMDKHSHRLRLELCIATYTNTEGLKIQNETKQSTKTHKQRQVKKQKLLVFS